MSVGLLELCRPCPDTAGKQKTQVCWPKDLHVLVVCVVGVEEADAWIASTLSEIALQVFKRFGEVCKACKDLEYAVSAISSARAGHKGITARRTDIL